MAHFAQLAGGGRVIHVSVVDNAKILDPVTGLESEALGIALQQRIHGIDTRWVQTSYNGSTRGKFAGIGDDYDGALFLSPIGPQPYAAWVLNGRTWEPPTPQPSPAHEWDAATSAWVDATGAMDNVTFTLRFTGTEQERIKASVDALVKGAIAKLKKTPRVRPKHPDTIALVTMLDNKGLLDDATRKAALLNPTP